MNQNEIDEALALADATKDVDMSSSGNVLKVMGGSPWVGLRKQHSALQVLARAYREKKDK